MLPLMLDDDVETVSLAVVHLSERRFTVAVITFDLRHWLLQPCGYLSKVRIPEYFGRASFVVSMPWFLA